MTVQLRSILFCHAVAFPPLLLALGLALASVPLSAQKPLADGNTGLRKKSLEEALQPSEADLSKRITPVVRAVQGTADSVVNILIRHPGGPGIFSPGGSDLEGQGSGVILDEGGLVITNWHVVLHVTPESQRYAEVRLKSGESYRSKVLSKSPEYDLALLQLELPKGQKVKPVTLGDSDSLMVGETVIAIGNPRGQANTVTVGVLSAEHRSINVRAPDGTVRGYKDLLQTDAAINQGNSGGALLDITGKLIGINNAMSQNSENIGFAIPVNTVRRVFHEVLLSSENLASLYLGMTIQDIQGRPVVAKVTPESPAHQVGIQTGDVLLEAQNQPVKSTLDYARSMLGATPAKAFPLLIERRGKKLLKQPRPLSNASWSVIRRIGAEFELVTFKQEPELLKTATAKLYAELQRTTRPRFSSYLPAALRVLRVHSGSPASRLKLQKGDLLLGIQVMVADFFTRRMQLQTYGSLEELDSGLHVLSQRMTDPEYDVWVLRNGEVLEGTLEVPRL